MGTGKFQETTDTDEHEPLYPTDVAFFKWLKAPNTAKGIRGRHELI